MKDDLSPDWLSTNDDETSSAPDTTDAAPAPVAVRIPVGTQRSVSRTPAAVVGILMVFALGFSVFQGADGLIGQVPGIPAKKLETAIEIRITDEGVIPRTVKVIPGQKIVWINEQGIPHILESETLVGENGSFLYTPAIFPGAEQEFWISAAQEPGRHSYLSTTSVEIYGEIDVVAEGSQRAAAPNEEEEEEFDESEFDQDAEAYEEEETDFEEFEEEEEPEEVAVIADELPETIDSSDPLAPVGSVTGQAEKQETTDQEALIPFNPYKIGSDKTGPDGSELHGGAPLISRPGFKPYRNTDTGPTLWIVSAASIAVLFWATRRCFARIK